MGRPKREKRSARLEVKKPKYLKKPSIERLMKILINRKRFLM